MDFQESLHQVRGNTPSLEASGNILIDRQYGTDTREQRGQMYSKWSEEEDADLIKHYADGLKWDKISTLLPGRSSASCRLHYKNNLEKDAEVDEGRKYKLDGSSEKQGEWDEDRKFRFARLYERHKADMWSQIAEEMSVPWRTTEAMHWTMGDQEMARRTGETPLMSNISVTHESALSVRLPPISQMGDQDMARRAGGTPSMANTSLNHESASSIILPSISQMGLSGS